MNRETWQLKVPLDAVLFDCDGTLSSIEGIDVLASYAGADVFQVVQALTADAMGRTGINASLYEKRLSLIRPSASQVATLAESYFVHRVSDAADVIALLQHLGKKVYVISAGLLPAVTNFAGKLGVPPQNVFAVDIQFDAAGAYQHFDAASPLIRNDGKRVIVEEIKKQCPRVLYVGDGLNDLAVRDLAARFVGYGGAYYRQNIAEQCEFYVRVPSLLPLLPLALTWEEGERLSEGERMLYEEGAASLL